jgi:hypothetical protein
VCRVNTNQNLDISSSSVKMIDSFLMLVCLAVALLHVVMVTNYAVKFRIIYLALLSCCSMNACRLIVVTTYVTQFYVTLVPSSG